MEIKKLWEKNNFPKCELCKKECQGRLEYDNLCSNLNYLYEYAEKNYEKNKESFTELKKHLTKNEKISIFSFGCGLGLDYIGAKEVFNENFIYNGIDNCNWAIKDTAAYKNFTPSLPKTINYENGMFLLTATTNNAVVCFFNSLFTIANNTKNLETQLIDALENKDNFYIICNYTINNNYHMPQEESNTLDKISEKLNKYYHLKRFEILDGKGIIIKASKR